MFKISSAYQAYRNKITNKLFGTVHMEAQGKRRGYVLISYITEPFTIAPWEPLSNFHTNYWECYEIARLFTEKGYSVDIINAKDKNFIPKKPYTACVDAENNLERFSPYLPKNCKKIFHILISHWEEYNEAENKRLQELKIRRGIELKPRRRMEPSRNAEIADYLEGFGNNAIFRTFVRFGKPISFIPISAVVNYKFSENKNFTDARKHFLWIGGGGSVLKGLDITLEAFSKMPNLHLHVCGPVSAEKDFAEAYNKELYETPNIHVYGRIDVAGKKFGDIIDKCAAIVYPSAGEGSSGAVVQAMHAGLVPIITHETGIQEDSGYIPLENPTPQSVSKAVQDFANTSPEKIRELSHKIWLYARKRYTRGEFSRTYKKFIEEKLGL